MCQSISYRTGRCCNTSNQADRQKEERGDCDVCHCERHKHNRFVKVWLIKLNAPEDDAALMQPFNLFCVFSRLFLFASHIDRWKPEFEKYWKDCTCCSRSIVKTPDKHFFAQEISYFWSNYGSISAHCHWFCWWKCWGKKRPKHCVRCFFFISVQRLSSIASTVVTWCQTYFKNENTIKYIFFLKTQIVPSSGVTIAGHFNIFVPDMELYN